MPEPKKFALDRSKLQRPRGRRPVLQNCTIHELRVDDAYQRSTAAGTSRTLIRKIAKEWDWSLCQPLVVAERTDGQLFVVDGQHRHAAAVLRGDIHDLPCVVHRYARPADEAAHFVALNRQRKPLNAIDLFKASLAGGDDNALAVMRLIRDAGLSLAPHTNFTAWKPGMVSNIGGIIRCHKKHGEELTARSLRVLRDAFSGQVLRYAGTLFIGIVALLVERRHTVDDQLLVLVLGGGSQADWMKDIASAEGEYSVHRSVAAAIAVRQAYDEAAAEAHDEQHLEAAE